MNPYEPIFPIDSGTMASAIGASAGITKREFFSAMAMQGIIANQRTAKFNPSYSDVAVHAVAQADALIAELSK